MFLAPPREREATSWLLAAVWTLGIFVAIPLARMVQEQVQERWGRATFGYVTVAVILAGTVLAFRALPRPRGVRVVRAVVLLGTSTVFVAYALRLGTEEAMHFVQYGVLGVLVYRALTHRVRDAGVYVVAVLIGTIVGTLDELVQWLTPRRFWGLADIWLNLFAVTLVQVGIGLGIAPPIIRGRPAAVTLRWISRLGACAVVLLGASLLNTPARVSWYASRVPGLASLARNPSMMMEYGYLYEGPETGRFRSRLSPVALAATDRARAAEAAALLDRYRDDQLYEQFLATITPVVDPFVHEVRVRLYRRNRYLALAEAAADPGERQAHLKHSGLKHAGPCSR